MEEKASNNSFAKALNVPSSFNTNYKNLNHLHIEGFNMNKKFVLSAYMLVLFVSNIIFILSIAAEEVQTVIYIDPPTIEAVPGQAFNITTCIANVTDLKAWQVVIYYRNNIVNALEAFEGPFLKAAGDTIFPEPAIWNDWNATHGCVMIGCCIQGSVPGVSGNGVLATIKFGCIGPGDTILKICVDPDDSFILNSDLEDVPIEAEDGYITSGPAPHDVAIISATPSSTEAFAGQIVNLTVVSKNAGTTTENFNVTACYNSHVIGTEALTDIAPSEETTLQFVWNTSDVPIGTYVIKVLASVIPGETNLMNNVYVDSTIKIKPAYDLSVRVETPTHLIEGEVGLLKATVTNVGWKDIETDVKVQLLIDENIVNEIIVAKLEVGASEEITYLWTPTVTGTYTVRAYAPPIAGEEITLNNVATEIVTVSPPKIPTVQIDPWRRYVNVGEFVKVHIRIYDATDLYAWQIKIHYNPEVLEFRNIWLSDTHVFAGASYTAPDPKVGEDHILYGVSLLGAAEPFSGSGILCEVDFKAKARGSSNLQLIDEETFLLDSDLNSISIQIVNSWVDVFGDIIEIKNVETTRTDVYTEWIIEVNATVRNNDNIPQSFSVTAYFASELKIIRKVSDLPPGEEATLTFYMDTSTLTPYVDYAIWAEATIIIDETWAYNNFWFFWAEVVPLSMSAHGWSFPGIVTTRIVPDIDGNTKVDIRDVGIAALAFGSYPEHQRWNLLADMNQDDKVNIRDLALVAKNFGKSVY